MQNETTVLGQIAVVASVVALVGSFILFALFIWAEWWSGKWEEVIFDHFPATIGLPAAAAASFIIVTIFRAVEGQIEFSGLGFVFKGASGPIVMWVLCFVSIVFGIRTLW